MIVCMYVCMYVCMHACCEVVKTYPRASDVGTTLKCS